VDVGVNQTLHSSVLASLHVSARGAGEEAIDVRLRIPDAEEPPFAKVRS
jgi:hypothetical protein